jgi:hypothetical protein
LRLSHGSVGSISGAPLLSNASFDAIMERAMSQDENVTRRDLLATAGAAGLGSLTVGATESTASPQEKPQDQLQAAKGSGKRPKDLKRLSRVEFKEEIVMMEKAKPVVMDEVQYRNWLDHTILSRFERGEKMLDRVRAVLRQIADEHKDEARKNDVALALNELENSIVAFQYGALGYNIMYRPTINNQEVKATILWNDPAGNTGDGRK